ncbi:hypothetical protein PAXRUDRAFT_130803 [Paxillus rubicundulus Ve08.2h10]|uniref:Uncharacterized protein n=1 Tax=Paxillus rubicundulus Ve08.2h10 TaxID=930991 RepID=A0A0D0ECV2_9AGAM|nr:hypothetical protein PAXRUDRAFT_130803 [Paxillus rubicundulus Ve08.2h10]
MRRPNPGRQETDAILSYYQSAEAGRGGSTSPSPPRSPSTITSSTSSSRSSDYSSDKESPATRTSSHPIQPHAASPSETLLTTSARRRTSVPPQGGTDRRRLGIVQMNTPEPPAHDGKKRSTEHATRSFDSSGAPSSGSRSRRSLATHWGDLALVAPPGAPPDTPSDLTPPMSAHTFNPQHSVSIGHPVSSSRSHTRSSSEAVGAFTKRSGWHVPRKSSREVAIVGTTSFPGAAVSVLQQPSKASPATDSLKPPLFQIPQSRSPSPGTSEISDSSSSANRGRLRKDALTPGVSPIKGLKELTTPVRMPNICIGDSKDISDYVVSPVVIHLSPQSPSPSSRPSSQTISPKTNLSGPLATMMPSSYLYYQPGLHATAGPLPPPPQAVFNIDPKAPPPPRPPRHSPVRRKGDLEAVKQSLQLPPHVAAALRTRPSSTPTRNETVPSCPLSTIVPVVASPPKGSSKYVSRFSQKLNLKHDSKSNHVREGAFPPSRLPTLDSETLAASPEDVTITLPRPDSMDDLVMSVGLAIDDMGIISSSDVPPPTVIEPPRRHEGRNGRRGLEIRRGENRLSISPSTSPEPPHPPHPPPPPSPPCSEESLAHSWVDPDKTFTLSGEKVPPVPAKNDISSLDRKSLKNALNIKRFSSLPRTPSLMSLNRLSAGSKRSSRTPSPSVAHSVPGPKPRVRRTRSTSPPAMHFADLIVKKSALERSMGYADKINELYNHDCGLGDWVAETRHKALHPQSSVKRLTVNSSGGPRAPSTSSPSIAPRHISQSSTDSGVTFPRRADAYSATDLSARPIGDNSQPNAPPPLPYPALAAAPRSGPSRASTIIATSSTSSARSTATPSLTAKSPVSFFTSLGRKTSIKKEKGGPLTPTPHVNVLSKSPPRTKQPSPCLANPPPVTQSVPGGPRAPPNRMQRSQTIIISPQNSLNGASHQRSSTLAGRLSLLNGRANADKQNDCMSEAEFSRQVDELAAILPKADRDVLAIYLRRAGQDTLAIGQYLDDVKNGTLRYE